MKSFHNTPFKNQDKDHFTYRIGLFLEEYSLSMGPISRFTSLVWVFFHVVLLSLNAWGSSTQASLDSIEAVPNGNLLLVFTLNGKKHFVMDDDGVATLATLNFLILQDPQNDILGRRKSFDAVIDSPIPGWNELRQAVRVGLQKAQKDFYNSIRPSSQHQAMHAEINQVSDWLERLENRPPTYREFGEKVGGWLERHGSHYSYQGKALYDPSHTLGKIFAERGYKLAADMSKLTSQKATFKFPVSGLRDFISSANVEFTECQRLISGQRARLH